MLPRRSKAKRARAKSEANDARIERLRDDSKAVLSVLVPRLHEALIEKASPSERCYAIKSRTKSSERIADIIQSAGQDEIPKALSRIPDICGLRVVTAYQNQVPGTVARIISLIESDFNGDPSLGFSKDLSIDVEITEPRPEGEHSALSDAVRLATQEFHRLSEPTRRNRGEFSMVTITARVIKPSTSAKVLPVEIQVRSGMEDVGAELDDRLRYGRGNGEGVSWMKHLNVLRGLIDGLVGYVDVIQKHAQDDPVVVPSSSVQVKSVRSGREQLQLFQDLPDELRVKLENAFAIWEQAQSARGSQGGMPGLFRHAADAFSNVHHDLSGYPDSSLGNRRFPSRQGRASLYAALYR
ncbi:hypothetical protein AJ87_14905 [Rhizobium yanglingense]|nr:hypothetical protein AJ87_14905 [Rhizobium yanglingense]